MRAWATVCDKPASCVFPLLSSTDAVKDRLISLEAALTILKLSSSIYPIGSWARTRASAAGGEDVLEEWNLRSTLASWSWRAIDELRGDEDNRMFPPVDVDVNVFVDDYLNRTPTSCAWARRIAATRNPTKSIPPSIPFSTTTIYYTSIPAQPRANGFRCL